MIKNRENNTDVLFTQGKLIKTERMDYSFEVILLSGMVGTGKSTFLERFIYNVYKPYNGTGSTCKDKNIFIDGTGVNLKIWDTSGQDRFRSLNALMISGVKGVILTYDIADQNSFLTAEEMIPIINKNSEKDVSRLFLGLKRDLKYTRAVPLHEVQAFAEKHNMNYMEASAKTGENVDEVFHTLAAEIKNRIDLSMTSTSKLETVKAALKPRKTQLPQSSEEEANEELRLLGLESNEGLQEIMKLGTYRCYQNRIFLVGQFAVGKTTLAKILIGEELPEKRIPTDGIWIHVGKAGMYLKEKKWICLPKGSTNLDIVAGMLVSLEPQENKHTDVEEQFCSSNIPVKTKEKLEINKDMHEIQLESQRIIPHSEGDVKNDPQVKSTVLQSTIPPQKKLMDLVLDAIKDGKYKQKIILFDLWDFGGQKEFYMTHQLFITNRGIFVLMFDARHSLCLKKDCTIAGQQEQSAAVYLVHWVNSILTYCKKGIKGFPRIFVVATHKDAISKEIIDLYRDQLMDSLDDLFKSHAGLPHLEYRPLHFINATDINDPEIELLRQRLIQRATDHPRWGEEMPTAWVPLELLIIQEVELGNNIITKQELRDLNSKNEFMVLSEIQLDTFLKVQHSLGKLLFFDDVNIRDFIIINPVFLVEVLRSIITDRQFWPNDKDLVKIFQSLQDTGTIERKDIYVLWNQESFIHIKKYKEFMINILIHLDILVAPQQPSEDENLEQLDSSLFFVPCMIRQRDNTKYMANKCSAQTAIIMAYRFVEEVIPPALTYRFLASFVTMWEVKIYKGSRMLFSNLLVVEIDKNHDVAVEVEGKRVIVFLIHTENVEHIVPTLGSAIQECLTAAIHRISEFYSLLSGHEDANVKHVIPFEIDFGVVCKSWFSSSICFFPHKDMATAGRFKCQNGKSHEVKHLSIWFAEKVSSEKCEDTCPGLERVALEQCPLNQHIRRLVAEIDPYKCRNIIVHLGVTINTWENLEYQFQHQNPDDLKFMAVLKWKEENKDASFSKLQEALEECDLNRHILCQVLRDIDPEMHKEYLDKYSSKIREKTPSISVLRCIANHIGESSLQLGIELGLDIVEIQHIQCQFKDKLLDQNREILRRWKQNKNISKPTVENLVKTLCRIGKKRCLDGVHF